MNEKNKIFEINKVAIAVLALLLVSSSFLMLGNSVIIKDSIEATPLSTTKDYGDIMQYEWTAINGNENQDGFSAGPAPDRPDVLWKTAVSGANGYVSVFNGKAFVLSGSTVRAFDAFTGTLVWNTTLKMASASRGAATKIDNTYFFVDCNGPEVHRISDGSFVANYTVPYWSYMGGGSQYFPGAWSSTLKMKWGISFDGVTKKGLINAISLADPTNPVLAWTFVADEASEISTYGDGKLLVGTTAGVVYALDGRTGDYLWRAPKTGVAQQHGLFYDGKFYEAASSQTVTCWDTNGNVLWEYDSNVLGTRSYFAMNSAAGHGRIYDVSIAVEPHGWACCWDANTGELLWKQPAYKNIHYSVPAVADGKVYVTTCDQAAGRVTAGLVMPGIEMACFDAYTGTQLWKLPNVNIALPSIAYGNLYGIYSGTVYCIGQQAKDWNFGYAGNVEQPRVTVGQSGPSDLSNPRWVFETGAKVAGSAAVVDGKVYIGSEDHNWYCLDAYTGKKIWNFTTGWRIGASAAVVNGKVYTGADDGNFYCLDANTGTQLWKTPAGGLITWIIMPQMLQSRSSPIIVNGNLYAGSLDGKVYCLNPADGSVKWTYVTGGPIGGSPAYANGVIYITSTDTYLYALDASTGAFKWKSIPLNLDVYTTPDKGSRWDVYFFSTATPTVANGVVYVPAGVTMGGLWPASKYAWPGNPSPGGANGGALRLAAFNANTGASLWNQTIAGNSGGVWTPVYYKGNLYIVEFMQVTCENATAPGTGPVAVAGFMRQPAGNRTWAQWLGYEILSSVAYVDDLRGPKVYVGCDVGSVTVINGTSGQAISSYQTGSNVEASPTIWEGKLYIGSSDRNVYCFDDSPIVDFRINAASSKGDTMWSNETITIGGQLQSNPKELLWQGSAYEPVDSDMHPGIPNAKVVVSFNKPDGSSENVTATTDYLGKFSVSYNPTQVGNWGWVAYYEGMRTAGITYNAAYSEWNPLNVATPSTPSTPTVTPTPGVTPSPEATATPVQNAGFPMEYVYAIVAVIVIVIVAIVAYVFLKSKKATQ